MSDNYNHHDCHHPDMAVPAEPKIINRIIYGLVFHPRGQLHNVEQSWHHSFQLQLPDVSTLTSYRAPMCEGSLTLCWSYSGLGELALHNAKFFLILHTFINHSGHDHRLSMAQNFTISGSNTLSVLFSSLSLFVVFSSLVTVYNNNIIIM